eukprot:COSAG06_NODE_11393_length_1516_cov_1.510939_1_plen_31_part_10
MATSNRMARASHRTDAAQRPETACFSLCLEL